MNTHVNETAPYFRNENPHLWWFKALSCIRFFLFRYMWVKWRFVAGWTRRCWVACMIYDMSVPRQYSVHETKYFSIRWTYNRPWHQEGVTRKHWIISLLRRRYYFEKPQLIDRRRYLFSTVFLWTSSHSHVTDRDCVKKIPHDNRSVVESASTCCWRKEREA